jgi:hypothetical protein
MGLFCLVTKFSHDSPPSIPCVRPFKTFLHHQAVLTRNKATRNIAKNVILAPCHLKYGRNVALIRLIWFMEQGKMWLSNFHLTLFCQLFQAFCPVLSKIGLTFPHTNYHPEPVESQILSLAIAESFGQQFRVSWHIHRPLGLYTSKHKGKIIPSTSS